MILYLYKWLTSGCLHMVRKNFVVVISINILKPGFIIQLKQNHLKRMAHLVCLKKNQVKLIEKAHKHNYEL